MRRLRTLTASLFAALMMVALAQSPTRALQSSFDVIVVGSEPEGIVAAVAAAESGADTLLVTADDRLGGLFVLGELSMLDLRTKPFNYQQGLFLRWWLRVGMATGFDVRQAERAFEQLLAEAGVSVLRGVDAAPLQDGNGAVAGIRIEGLALTAPQVIDATADMDLAAAAGADHDVGFASLGVDQRMADTLVFRIEGLDWQRLRAEIEQRGASFATIDDHVAWGHFGGVPAAYNASSADLRLRGLNLGRQRDGSVLVNALLIYGLDPFEPGSLLQGRAKAEREAPRIVDYLADTLPGFEGAVYGGVAPRLYVRESRHLHALCTLTVQDVLDNRVSVWDVATGGYPLDVQTLTPNDSGFVYGQPDIYGVRLCTTVPRSVDGLWVVGRAAGFDPLAASSARVVPFGMALAEAVGVAAALATDRHLSPAELVVASDLVGEVRRRLLDRGALLPPTEQLPPTGPRDHPYFAAYRLLLGRGLAVGGYRNDPRLDEPSPAIGYIYMLANVGQRFLGRDDLGAELIATFGLPEGPLSAALALEISYRAACSVRGCPSQSSWIGLERTDLVPEGFRPGDILTRGEMYQLAAGFASLANR